jgi:transcriptional regulator with XRE-family HTH domain
MTDPTPEPVTLGAYLKAQRDAANLTQETLAGRIGVSRQAVAQWEANISVPGPRALHFLAEQLPGLDPARMLALIPSGTR